MSNPMLSAFLGNQILTGENYVQWYSNINLILICSNNQFVLTEKCPRLEPNASENVLEAYNHWTNINAMVRLYLLTNMSSALKIKHEKLATAYEIMKSLRQMFCRATTLGRQEAISAIMNCRMKLGTSVREHLLKMIQHFLELEINGGIIGHSTQVVMILETLSLDFVPFKTNYILNKKRLSMTELLNELEIFEALIREKEAKTNVVVPKIVSKPSSLKRKFDEKEVSYSNNQKKENVKNGKKIIKKPKGICNHCGQDGHWKRNCLFYLAQLREKKAQDASVFPKALTIGRS